LEAARPIKIAIVGGGCAAMAAAFELTRPEHAKKYKVTVYQMGWRLGGKGASGRGPNGRIEEHGLHIWLGYYENAFRLLRECYAELAAGSKDRSFGSWRDAFFPDPYVGVSEKTAAGAWAHLTVDFPPAPGEPGDPQAPDLLSVRNYVVRAATLLRRLLVGVETTEGPDQRQPVAIRADGEALALTAPEEIGKRAESLLRYGLLGTVAIAVEALVLVEAALKTVSDVAQGVLVRLLQAVAAAVKGRLENLVAVDDDVRRRWEIVDLVLATLVGVFRFGLLSHPRGLDAIDPYDCREWLRLNGASERSLNSAFLRGLYDLVFAYEGGDPDRPRLAAGVALRGSFRMFFTYRGAFFWKMRRGMGDVVFAPFYEALRARGVRFAFFHRLENVRLARTANGETPHVEALEFDVQAKVRDGRDYQPLIEVRGKPCWPSKPDYAQLEDGARIESESRDFESPSDPRKVATRTLRVTKDFDFVVLGVGVGAIPHVCRELVAGNARWRDMTRKVTTVATQAFQIWLREDLQELGWDAPPVTLSAFAKPFDTWSDMGQVIPAEGWARPPTTVAYFCGALADSPPGAPASSLKASRRAVRDNAVAFLDKEAHHLWPKAVDGTGRFRWDLLVGADEANGDRSGHRRRRGRQRFDSQFWTANVNPSERYTQSLPGTIEYRISPLDDAYDNLTVAGDWTDSGLNLGSVEAAVMSGRLAAHALTGSPALEDIVGFDHP
jgi:uncharacterized protein with NAD-binding domain and iron-sulfur cluster